MVGSSLISSGGNVSIHANLPVTLQCSAASGVALMLYAVSPSGQQAQYFVSPARFRSHDHMRTQQQRACTERSTHMLLHKLAHTPGSDRRLCVQHQTSKRTEPLVTVFNKPHTANGALRVAFRLVSNSASELGLSQGRRCPADCMTRANAFRGLPGRPLPHKRTAKVGSCHETASVHRSIPPTNLQ
jgi:hypothetical protein